MIDRSFLRTLHELEIDSRAWVTELLRTWRNAWDAAAEGERANAISEWGDLRPSVRVDVHYCAWPDRPYATSALVFRRTDGGDGDVRVRLFDPDSEHGGAAQREESVDSWLRGWTRSMDSNWTPGRPADPPVDLIARTGWKRPDLCEWNWPDDFMRLNPADIVASAFRKSARATPAVQPDFGPPQHLYQGGQRRERNALATWMTDSNNAARLMNHLGIEGPWWCVLNLQRKAVFGHYDGDVDLVAGPLRFTLADSEWAERLQVERARSKLVTNPDFIRDRIVRAAVHECMLEWPPALDHVVACDVKSSWFDGENGVLKCTHVGEAQRVQGSIELLVDEGMDRVAFLHLVATKPRAVCGWGPWDVAEFDMHAALKRIQMIYTPNALAGVGYFASVTGAVLHAPESDAGSGSGVIVVQPASVLAQGDRGETWRSILRDTLASLAKPRTLPAQFIPCERCGRLSKMYDASYTDCECPR